MVFMYTRAGSTIVLVIATMLWSMMKAITTHCSTHTANTNVSIPGMT